MNSKDEFSGMRELTSFQMDHSPMGNLIILRSSFINTLASIDLKNVQSYPDQGVMIRLSTAKLLIQELQKRIDSIESHTDADTEHHFIM
ncbi:hypothetical protein ACWKX9_17645 [Enterobacter asburiae]